MMKANSMVQWTEHSQNNRLVNPPSLPWLSEISGAIHLVQPGLQQAGRQTKISKFLILIVHQNIRLFISFNQGTASLQQY